MCLLCWVVFLNLGITQITNVTEKCRGFFFFFFALAKSETLVLVSSCFLVFLLSPLVKGRVQINIAAISAENLNAVIHIVTVYHACVVIIVK